MRGIDLTPLFRSSVGFDRLMYLMDSAMKAEESAISYPPYNIEKLGEDIYRITMAVAGFSDDDIDITLQNNTLSVRGKSQKEKEGEEVEYLYRGIARRSFLRHFQLADFIKIEGAFLENGLLQITLVQEIPEAMKPQKISILTNRSEQKLLEYDDKKDDH